jgi:methylase of polypeptide subunit release factors
MDRLVLLHNVMTRLVGGLYAAPIDKEKTRRILDIGTGNGACKR